MTTHLQAEFDAIRGRLNERLRELKRARHLDASNSEFFEPSSSTQENATLRRQEMTAIEIALDRLSRGDFDVCRLCGESIGIDRLRADPLVTHCLDCADRAK